MKPPLLLIACAVLVLGACGADNMADDTENDCAGHGEYLHGHCHCERGYMQTADEQSCVELADIDEPDAPSDEPDGPMDEPDAPVDEPAELVFNPGTQTARTRTESGGERVWVLNGVDGMSVLTVENYESYGGPTTPGTVTMTAQETSYATCATCLLYQTGCTAHDDHFHCSTTYMPRAEGTVELTALGTAAGETFSGSLTNIVFQEVTINQQLETTPVPGAQAYRLASWAFSAALTP